MKNIKILVTILALMSSGSLWAVSPAAPVSVSITSTFESGGTLYWDYVAAADIYNVYQNGTFLGTQTNNVYKITGLNQGVQYTFGISSVNSGGTEGAVSAYVTFTPTVSSLTIDTFKPIVGVSVGYGVGFIPTPLWTPASGKKFRLMAYSLSADVSGVYTLFDGTVTITAEYLSSTGPGRYVSFGNGYLSSSSNNTITCVGPVNSDLAGILMGTEQ